MPLLPSGVLSRYSVFRRRTKPGAEPGTIRVAPEAPPPEIHVIGYGPDVLEEHDLDSVDELPALLDRFPIVWINVEGLGDERTDDQEYDDQRHQAGVEELAKRGQEIGGAAATDDHRAGDRQHPRGDQNPLEAQVREPFHPQPLLILIVIFVLILTEMD